MAPQVGRSTRFLASSEEDSRAHGQGVRYRWTGADWQKINEGLQVKKCASPDGTDETFILCRSAARKEKEQAMLERFRVFGHASS